MQNNLSMKAFVLDLLKTNLAVLYEYHSEKHSLYVMEKAIEIGRYEGCTEEEIRLLSVAALWHDTGFIITNGNHEEEGCALARRYLPGYGYEAGELTAICGMIMATKLPQSPQNKLEEIIADADLEYLGTDSAESQAASLYRETKSLHPGLTEEAWNEIQISFLLEHHYFTSYCKAFTEPGRSAYLAKLIAGRR